MSAATPPARLSVAEAQAILDDVFAPWVLDLGLSVTRVGDAGAVLTMAFSERLCRVGGIICGQAMVSAADTAMVIAASVARGGFLPIGTVDMTVSYLRPAAATDLVIDAVVMRLGRSMCFCRAMIATADEGRDCAHVVATYALPQEAG